MICVDIIDVMKGREIIFKQAPCRPDGVISSDGQQESKEGTCRCSENPTGCCVDGIGRILPLQLKEDIPPQKPNLVNYANN